MANKTQDSLDLLEKRISELVEYCQTLKDENAKLKQAIADAEVQHTQLLSVYAGASEQVRQAIADLEAIGKLN